LLIAVVGIALAMSQPKAKPVVTAPAVTPTPTSTPTPTPTKTPDVTMQINSTPMGAEVFRAADGMLLGLTPFKTTAAPTNGTAVFMLRLGGYEDARAQLPADKGGTTSVTMTKIKVKSSRPGKSEGKPRKRVGDGAVDPF